MSGEQLERSILERKERTELHAIAEAMSLKPATRSKKADLIDQILRATGIGADAGSAAAKNGHATSIDDAHVAVPKPRRTRRTASAAAETTADTNGTAATATLAETTTASESAVQMELTEAKRSSARADRVQTDEPATAAAPAGPKTSAGDDTPASGDQADGSDHSDHSDNGGQSEAGGEGFGEWTATAASETTQQPRPQRDRKSVV